MKEIVESARKSLADTYVMSFAAHSYHWNVVGPDFPQLHDFFGDLYEELEDAIDALAEHIRQLDVFAPKSLAELIEYSNIEHDDTVLTPTGMISRLYEINDTVIETITQTYELAEEEKMFAYSNYLQDRLTAHMKHRWMLKSIGLKK